MWSGRTGICRPFRAGTPPRCRSRLVSRRRVRALRADLAERLRRGGKRSRLRRLACGSLPNLIRKCGGDSGTISRAARISEVPVGEKMLIELYRDERLFSLFFSFSDWPERKRRALAHRRVAGEESHWRKRARHDRRLRFSSHAAPFPGDCRWKIGGSALNEKARRKICAALRGSELVKWQFRGVAQTGLMVPRHLPGRERARRQLTWSSEFSSGCWSSMSPIIRS